MSCNGCKYYIPQTQISKDLYTIDFCIKDNDAIRSPKKCKNYITEKSFDRLRKLNRINERRKIIYKYLVDKSNCEECQKMLFRKGYSTRTNSQNIFNPYTKFSDFDDDYYVIEVMEYWNLIVMNYNVICWNTLEESEKDGTNIPIKKFYSRIKKLNRINEN